MASFTKTMSGDSRYSIKLTFEETNANPQTSTSDGTYKLEATKQSGTGLWSSSGNDIEITINGVKVIDTTIGYDFRTNGSKPKTITLASGTITGIQHNSDGTKTIQVSGYFKDNANNLGEATASGSVTLTPLHTNPSNFTYQMTETNNALINVGIQDNVVVANLSNKSFSVNATLYDNAQIKDVTIYDGVNFHRTDYANFPPTYDFSRYGSSNALAYGGLENQTPIALRLTDTKGGYVLSNNVYEGGLTPAYNYYDYIPYTKVSLVETNTNVKRLGQVSGLAKINVEGTYYNGNIGNVSQNGNYTQTSDTIFETNKNYFILNGSNYTLLVEGTDYNNGDSIENYFDIVYEFALYKPTIRFMFWKLGDTKPTTYNYTIPSNNITINNGIFSVSNYQFGSTDETTPIYLNPLFAYRFEFIVEDNFTSAISNEKAISIGYSTWTEYKDRVDFVKITINGVEITIPKVLYQGNASATLTLNDTYTNYKYIEIFYCYNDDTSFNVCKIPTNIGSRVQLVGDYDNGSILYHNVAIYNFSGNKLNRTNEVRWRYEDGAAVRRTNNTTDIKIKLILGYE